MDSAPTELPVRINKYLAQASLGSRRACEQIILDGRVQVDGETVTDLSYRVSPDAVVRVDGRILYRDRHVTVFALNKPPRVLTSERDPQGRPLAIDYLKHHYSGRLFSVGRLDFLSSGLLLFTNQGDLAQALMRPATKIDRIYTVETRDAISEEILQQAVRGVMVEGVQYRVHSFRRHSARRVSLTLQEGKNREIRRLFAHFRITVKRIHRVVYGSVQLGSLQEGQVRRLTATEVQRLYKVADCALPEDIAAGGENGRNNRRTRRDR
jgi:23S rRNA pseudouridine2605 synthase